MTRQEARKQWIEALRSGKYAQGAGALHMINTDRYCCLGVACDLFKDELYLEVRTSLDSDKTEFSGEESVAPKDVVDLLGLVDEFGSPRVDIDNNDEELTALNDNGTSFDRIAELLELGNYWEISKDDN